MKEIASQIESISKGTVKSSGHQLQEVQGTKEGERRKPARSFWLDLQVNIRIKLVFPVQIAITKQRLNIITRKEVHT